MKHFTFLIFLGWAILCFSCRKPDIILQNTAFTVGKYYYDYHINGNIYENYKTLNINWDGNLGRNKVYISGNENYEIPPEEKELSYFWGRDENYLLSGGCLYGSYQNKCASWGFSLYSTDYIYLPNYYSGLSKVDLYACEGKIYGAHIISDYGHVFKIRGKEYKTYRIEFYHPSQSNEPKSVGYIDAEIGLIQLEKYDLITDKLISVLTFNHK